MILNVCCRHTLLDAPVELRQPALLLEGSWPADEALAPRWALDEALDSRFAWIDREASRLAEQLAADSVVEEAASIARTIAPAWLNALGLRYYLVKLLRVIVFFSEIQPLRPGDVVQLLARQSRDEDYAELVEQLCRLAGATYEVRWTGRGPTPSEPVAADERWRRWAARLSAWLGPRIGRSDLRPRLVLCGNPRILDPVCGRRWPKARRSGGSTIAWRSRRGCVGVVTAWANWSAMRVRASRTGCGTA